jgi:hypothetical protein
MPIDVGLAFLLAILAFGVMVAGSGQGGQASHRRQLPRLLNHGILVMLIVFFVLGQRIVWINCLTGFAWRAWLLAYVLPAWFTALRNTAAI